MRSFYRSGYWILSASVCPVLIVISYVYYLYKKSEMTGQTLWPVLFVIAPLVLLIIAIRHANSTCNMLQDKVDGKRTRAMDMGLEGSQIAYQTMLLVAYLMIAVMVMMQILSNWTFLVLLSFPLAIKNIKLMKKANMDDLAIIRFLDNRTAQLALSFSLLMVAGNLIATL